MIKMLAISRGDKLKSMQILFTTLHPKINTEYESSYCNSLKMTANSVIFIYLFNRMKAGALPVLQME